LCSTPLGVTDFPTAGEQGHWLTCPYLEDVNHEVYGGLYSQKER
jgi:hypothetical protein